MFCFSFITSKDAGFFPEYFFTDKHEYILKRFIKLIKTQATLALKREVGKLYLEFFCPNYSLLIA